MLLRSFFFPFGPLEVNLFVAANEETREAFLVDAGVYGDPIPEFLRSYGLCLSTILITHLHRDHIDAIGRYLEAGANRVLTPAPIEAAPGAEIVRPGDRFRTAGYEFEVLPTSGHTPEGVSYYCPAEGICFVGDALFAGSVGGTSNDRDHAEEIGLIGKHLMSLPPETRIYSGHGPATNVGIEKAANPFLQPGFTRLP